MNTPRSVFLGDARPNADATELNATLLLQRSTNLLPAIRSAKNSDADTPDRSRVGAAPKLSNCPTVICWPAERDDDCNANSMSRSSGSLCVPRMRENKSLFRGHILARIGRGHEISIDNCSGSSGRISTMFATGKNICSKTIVYTSAGPICSGLVGANLKKNFPQFDDDRAELVRRFTSRSASRNWQMRP